MKTAASNKKVRELIKAVQDGKLLPRPEFQRRLVWSREDKNKFIDTLLRGYPFPEIYFADGDVDLETGEGTQLLVDGQQRVMTLVQYFTADSTFKLTTVPAYKELNEEGKKAFLQYDVACRDLGAISKEEIIEVFKRINATKYSLEDIEINNALYGGKLKTYSEKISEMDFLKNSGIFTSGDFKRMGDLKFALSIVGTFLIGYFNRDDEFEKLLQLYNDDFAEEEGINARLNSVIEFINECNFPKNSQLWKKADLFTLIIELDRILNFSKIKLDVESTVSRVESFYDNIENETLRNEIQSRYYKAALQASNDRGNRIRRGIIIEGIIMGKTNEEIIFAIS